MNMLWSPNPRKRRRKMSAKQRKYFGGGKRKRRIARRQAGFVAMPGFTHKRRGRRRSMRAVIRHSKRRARRAFASFSRSGAMGLLRAGAVGGAGAVLVDVAMGQIAPFLPAALAVPKDNQTGAVNYGYFGTKAALAIALGIYGRRLPVIGRYSEGMAEGALTLIAYQFMRPLVPATLNLGAYFNPRATQRTQGLSAYATPRIAVRSGGDTGRGSRAANVLSMVNAGSTARRPA